MRFQKKKQQLTQQNARQQRDDCLEFPTAIYEVEFQEDQLKSF